MISIILPTFNRSSILESTIKCVLNQTFEDYELIIINDASNDDTINIIKQFKVIDGRIKLIDNNKKPYNTKNCSTQTFGKLASKGDKNYSCPVNKVMNSIKLKY